jgi:hypothetical protein
MCAMSVHPFGHAPVTLSSPPLTSGKLRRGRLRPSILLDECNRGMLRLVACMFGLVVLCAACASPAGSVAAGAPPAAVPGAPSLEPVDPSAGPVVRPLDPEAPSSYVPVVRDGHSPRPTVKAGKGGFSPAAPVVYSDGVSVTVNRISHGVEKGQGPGVLPERPYTAIYLSFDNGSGQAIDLNQAVVTTTYGSPARIASPVYEDPAAQDFAGTVDPGNSISATYLFAIPPNERASVVVMVDFDAVHVAAEFTGGMR